MKKVIGLILLIVILSGCTPKSSVELVKDISSIPSPGHIQEQLNTILKVDAEVNIGDIDLRTISTIPCTFHVLDTSTALEILCPSEKVVSHEMTSTEGVGPNEQQNLYRFQSGSMLICGNTLCYYSTPFAKRVFEIYGDDFDEGESQKEFPFLTRQAVYSNIRRLCKSFGIHVDGLSIAAIDYKTIQKLDDTQKYSWDEKDSFYFVTIYPRCGELPLSSLSHGNLEDGSFMYGSSITAICSVEGLQYWNSNFLFQSENATGTSEGIIPVQAALDTLAAKYDLLITTASYTVTDINLVYLPTRAGYKAYELHPVWQFKLIENTKEKSSYYVNIDAITGNEIR